MEMEPRLRITVAHHAAADVLDLACKRPAAADPEAQAKRAKH